MGYGKHLPANTVGKARCLIGPNTYLLVLGAPGKSSDVCRRTAAVEQPRQCVLEEGFSIIHTIMQDYVIHIRVRGCQASEKEASSINESTCLQQISGPYSSAQYGCNVFRTGHDAHQLFSHQAKQTVHRISLSTASRKTNFEAANVDQAKCC